MNGSMKLPLLLALASGIAVGWFGYSDAYFPQHDVFSYYQLYHITYSSILNDRQIPLWEPYASYGIPSAFELLFTFGPTNALTALVGVLLRVTDIKLLFFGAIGIDFALIGTVSAYLARDFTGKCGPHVCFAAVAMPFTHYMETTTNYGYLCALTILFVMLFLLRFLQTRHGVYLIAAALALISSVYGNPQYLVVPKFYIGALFLLMAGLRYREVLTSEWRAILLSLLTVQALLLAALTVILAAGALAIDHEMLKNVAFIPRLRDPRTLAPALDDYLHDLSAPLDIRLFELFTGRPVSIPDIWTYFGAANLAILLSAFVIGWPIKFVPELLALILLIVVFALPDQFPLAEWAYYWVPGMNLFRPASAAVVFAKPLVVLVISAMLASPRLFEAGARLALLVISIAVLLCAVILQAKALPPLGNWDSVGFGWIAVGATLALTAAIALCRGRYWQRWAAFVLAVIAAGETVVYRADFEATFYAALDPARTSIAYTDLPFVEPWYQWPHQLIYQPTRVSGSHYPYFRARFALSGSIYHGLWDFIGIDPCISNSRSDSYSRGVADALRRRGASDPELTQGQLFGLSEYEARRYFGPTGKPHPHDLGDDFDAAFGCHQPKLTIGDPAGTARMIRFTANEAVVAVSTPLGGILTYRDAWTPGWQATVDGAPAVLYANADGFKAVAIAPGEHRVDFAFRPPVGEGLLFGLAVALVVSLVAQIVLACRNDRDREAPSPGRSAVRIARDAMDALFRGSRRASQWLKIGCPLPMPTSPQHPAPAPPGEEAPRSSAAASRNFALWQEARLAMERSGLRMSPRGRRSRWKSLLFHWATRAFGLSVRLLGLYLRGVRNARAIELSTVELAWPDLPAAFAGYHILHVSDTHFEALPALGADVLRLVDGLEVDLIVLTGDFRTLTHGPFERDIEPLGAILAAVKSRDGALAVLGNHDPAAIVAGLEVRGIRVLTNEFDRARARPRAHHRHGT